MLLRNALHDVAIQVPIVPIVVIAKPELKYIRHSWHVYVRFIMRCTMAKKPLRECVLYTHDEFYIVCPPCTNQMSLVYEFCASCACHSYSVHTLLSLQASDGAVR